MLKKLNSKQVSTILLSGFLLVNLFAVSITGFFLHDSKLQYKEQAFATTKNFSDILSNNISKTFEKSELVINSVSHHVQSFGVDNESEQFMQNSSKFLPELQSLIFINKKYQTIYSTDEQFDIDFSKNELIKKTLQSSSVVITHQEFKSSYYILMSKKILNEHDQFIGILVAVLPLNSVIQSFNNLNIGSHGILVLRDENLNLVGRFPFINSKISNTPPSKSLIELSSSVNSASYETITPIDNKLHIYSFKKINKYNYFVIAGLSEEDYLISWNKQFIQFSFIYFFFSFICALFSYAIYFLWKKESQKENRLSSILQSSSEGIYGVDDNGICTFCNSKALSLLGYKEHSEIVGKPIHNIIFKETFDNDFSINMNVERTMIRKNGSTFQSEIWQHPQLYENEISSSIITFVDISDKKDMDYLVWKQANYDSLTGIPNRTFFEEKLQETINQSQFEDTNFAVLFIDLDFFKDVNDNFGHHAGDELLKQVSQRLTNCVRERDIVARLGGDEFTIILKQIKEKSHIEKICSKIIEEIQKPFFINNHLCNIGSSIGITYFPDDSTSLEQLLQNADKAMYVAKESGRNRFSFFTKNLDLIIKQRLEISQDLKQAISNNELELFVQPIVNSHTKKIVKAEVLLRWKHNTKGYISPNDFIPIAEKNGTIHSIGEWVFKQSTSWLSNFLSQHPECHGFQLSVNVSPIQFMNSHFVHNIKEHLKNLNLPYGSIIIEITEGILLDHNNNTHDKFHELKDLGIQIAIDDFGTGYSAMSYLYKYDIDFIKVDRSFISDLNQDKNKKITRSLISMAKNLGIKVIAEGVENNEQANFLEEINCDYSQGFFFSKPQSIKNFKCHNCIETQCEYCS